MAAINLPIVSKFDDKGIKNAEAGLANFEKVAAGVAAAAAVAVGAIAIESIKKFTEFDSKLNQSIAIMGDVSDAMRNDMADAARQVALETTFAADEAAEAFFFLASAGLDAASSISAMPQVAKFAQAGMFDMATATDLLTDAQSALGLSVRGDANANLENMIKLSDTLVRANTLANASVQQFSEALTNKAAGSMRALGIELETGVAVLATFADQGIKGSQAGTTFNAMIRGLTNGVLKNSDAFEKYNIEVFDSEGNFNNLADIVSQMETAFGGMSKEQTRASLTSLGFTEETLAGTIALLGNSDAIKNYENELRSAAGFTDQVAKKQLLTPTAQFALLRSAMENVALEIGSVLAPALGGMAGLLAPLITDLLPGITNVLENHVVPAVESFTRVFTDTAVGLLEGSKTIESIFRVLFDNIIEFFTGNGLGELLEGFVEVRTTIVDAFIKVIPMVVDAIIRILPAIVQTLADMIPQLLDTAVETFMALVDAVVLVLPNIINALLLLLPQLLETVIGMLPDLVDSAIELFTGIITALIDVTPRIITTLMEALPRIIDALIDATPLLIEAGFELFMGIVDGLIDAMPEIIGASQDVIPAIEKAIIPTITKMQDLGRSIVQGIAKGIADNAPRLLEEAIREIDRLLVLGLKINLGIRSPSKVFAGIGENVVNGLEKGITDNLRMLENASIGMASTVTVAAESGLGGMSAPITLGNASQGRSSDVTFNITVNAGMGSDGQDIGRKIVDEILRFERSSGKVFARI